MNSLEKVLKIVRLTDIGQLRARNEDAVASDASIGLALLADGMGGYNAGDVASQMAALTITAELKLAFKHAQETHNTILTLDAQSYLLEAVDTANQAIYRVAQEQAHCEGMGTTLVTALFIDDQVIIGHIGDSRAYQLRQKQFARLTNDHSLLQEQLDNGLISLEQAKVATYKNFVTKALGVSPEMDLEINTFDVAVGDIYMLCSDGLSDLIEDDELGLTISQLRDNLEVAANTLIKLANQRGGKDNISVILIEVLAPFSLTKHNWLQKLIHKGK